VGNKSIATEGDTFGEIKTDGAFELLLFYKFSRNNTFFISNPEQIHSRLKLLGVNLNTGFFLFFKPD
jgi:hypothetical protein